MNLKFKNATQVKIADQMWAAQTPEEVRALINQYGHDGRVVYEMIIATAIDDVMSTDRADKLIATLKKKWKW